MADDEHSRAFVPGFLDELVPGLRKKVERLPALPVHPRVVRSLRDDGTHALVLMSFTRPANVRAFHAGLKPLIEAALLAELSRPAAELAEHYAPLSAIELYLFEEPTFDIGPALRPFALERADLGAPLAQKPLSLVRREVQLVDAAPSAEPCARYVARVAPSGHALRAPLHAALLKQAPRTPWGGEPGKLASVLGAFFTSQGVAGIAPTRSGIETLESIVVSQERGVLRLIEPLVFQALCDLIAVAAHSTWQTEAEWGVCEPDENGLTPPPVIRVSHGPDTWHVPLGEHVLRWCVMPAAVGESVPSLGAWAEHEFT